MDSTKKLLSALALVYFFTDHVSSYCIFNGTIDHLSINDEKSPLIYSYIKKPVIHYPSSDGCIWDNSIIHRLYIACPLKKICYTQQSSENGTCKESPTYLTQARDSQKLIMQGESVQLDFLSESDRIECEEPIEATMIKIGKSKHDKLQVYSVGYQINDVDFLSIYKIATFQGSIYLHATIAASAQVRPESTETYELQEGLIYDRKYINFMNIYDKDSQISKFHEMLQNEGLVNKFFDSNYLVPGRLITEQDFYYIPQQRSTFYYENTCPIWNTIYEDGGNWKLVSDIVRRLADSSYRDYKIIAVGLGDLEVSGKKIVLGGTIGSPGKIRIPRILAKVAIDDRKHSRGIAYYVSNDPHMTKYEMDKIILGTNTTNGYCKRLLECNKMHSEFDDTSKGLTYCCSLKDSKIWDKFDLDELIMLDED